MCILVSRGKKKFTHLIALKSAPCLRMIENLINFLCILLKLSYINWDEYTFKDFQAKVSK